MDTAEIFVLVIGTLLIVATLWFFFGEYLNERKNERKAKTTSPSAPLYACPMHSWITSDKAGDNCSICRMQLVLKAD